MLNIPHRGPIRCMSLTYSSCGDVLGAPSRGDLTSESREGESPGGRGRGSERPEERDWESAEGVSRPVSPSVRATRSTKAKERQEKRKCMNCETERRTSARRVGMLSFGWARVESTQTRGKVGL